MKHDTLNLIYIVCNWIYHILSLNKIESLFWLIKFINLQLDIYLEIILIGFVFYASSGINCFQFNINNI